MSLNTFHSTDGLTRITIGAVVKKEFKHHDAVIRVCNLVNIYKLLKAKQVLYVDMLDQYSIDFGEHSIGPYIEVKPVGMDATPRSGLEAFRAVECILQALMVRLLSFFLLIISECAIQMMHSGPSPVYHRDIRKPNILKSFSGDEWFLIDWSDASTAPMRAVRHLSKEEHSPRVHEDNHGAEVDIWGVGFYLRHLASCSRPLDAQAVKRIAIRWMEDRTITAEAALKEIHVCWKSPFVTFY